MSDPSIQVAPPVQQSLPTVATAAPPAPTVPVEYLQQLERLKLEAASAQAELKKRDASAEETKVALAALTAQLATSDAQKAELAASRKAEKIRYEARQAAMQHGAIDPDDVVALVSAGLTVTEAGDVVTAGDAPVKAGDFIKSFLEKKPHLAGRKVAQGSGASPFPTGAPNIDPPVQFDMQTREGATAALRAAILARAARDDARRAVKP